MNIKKVKYALFHKSSSKSDILLKLSDLKIENLNIDNNSSIKFLGVLLDKHKKLEGPYKDSRFQKSKIVGLLHRGGQVVTEASLKTITLKNQDSLVFELWKYCMGQHQCYKTN